MTFSGGLKGSNSPPRMCPTMSNHVHPMSNPFGAAGAAYGQKCHFWVKKGHFWTPLGPPGNIFWGPKGFKLTPPDVSNNVQPCSPNVQPIWGCWGCLWPKMMKIEVLLVGHPITQPTGQDWFISFCKIKQNSQPCYLMESAIFQIL